MSQSHPDTLPLHQRYFSEPELARHWGKSLRTLQRYRSEGTGPDFLKIGQSVFYRPQDITAFERKSLRHKNRARS